MSSPIIISFKDKKDQTITITIDVQLNELKQCLEFEGSRIQSLLERKIDFPLIDYRYWDSKRHITVRYNKVLVK